MALQRIERDAITDNAINAAKIADGTVVAAEIADDAIVTAKILNANVTTAKLAADCVDGTKIADDAINSEHYADGSIDNVHLATGIASSKLSGALPAVSGASLTGVYTADSLGANSHSKVVASTYNLSTASGNKDITGFGFNPKVIIAFWGESTSVNWGWGFMQLTQNVGYNIRNIGASTTGQVDQEGNLLSHKTNSSGGVGQVGTMTSITDGVRIAFTKTGSPTGTLYIKLIGFK